jgi:5-methylcytosine-specific restriction protein B
MNMSHVERYFADFLSAMESGEPIPLYEGNPRNAGNREVPRRLSLPGNLFVIGTVNVDETTYMFSPKVLDRANVIEFRMNGSEMSAFLEKPSKPDLEALKGKGSDYAESFVLASKRVVQVPTSVHPLFQLVMETFFKVLQSHHAEFGYRTAHEVGRFITFYHELAGSPDDDQWFAAAMDAAVVQKLLPKLHGSRVKLAKLLRALWMLTRYAPGLRPTEAKDPNEAEVVQAHYPLSADKIVRMWRLLAENGFASFAEA